MMLQQLKIGATVYTVAVEDNLHDFDRDGKRVNLNGHITYDDCMIKVNREVAPQRARIVLWHEALHGILENAALHDHDETLIDALAHGIVDLLISNPGLADYTLSGLSEAGNADGH